MDSVVYEYQMFLKKSCKCFTTLNSMDECASCYCASCYRPIIINAESSYVYSSWRFADLNLLTKGVIVDEVIVCLNCISDHFSREYKNQLGLFEALLKPLLESLLASSFRFTSMKNSFPTVLNGIIYQYILGDKSVRNKQFQKLPYEINIGYQTHLLHSFPQTKKILSLFADKKELDLVSKEKKIWENENERLNKEKKIWENENERLNKEKKRWEKENEELEKENETLKEVTKKLREERDDLNHLSERYLKQIIKQKTLFVNNKKKLWKDANARLKQEKEKWEDENARLKRERKRLEKENKNLDFFNRSYLNTINEVQKTNRRHINKIDKLKTDLNSYTNNMNNKESQIKLLLNENNSLKTRTSNLMKEINDSREDNKLLEEEKEKHLKQIKQQKTIIGITALFVAGLGLVKVYLASKKNKSSKKNNHLNHYYI